MKHKSSILTLAFLLLSLWSSAQESSVAMADAMRSNGKIYVVLGVVAILVAGLLGYVIYLDRKLAGIERKNQSNQ